MRKGLDWHITLMMAVILFVFSVVILWDALAGKTTASASPTTIPKQGCDTDADCQTNPDGAKCLQVWPGDINPFCGCYNSTLHCIGRRSGICGTNDKCI